jgi:hypothetical protein
LQDILLDYIRSEFAFDHIKNVRAGDPMQFYAYEHRTETDSYTLSLKERISTDAAGIATCLGLQAEARIELQVILDQIEAKLPHSTLLTVGGRNLPVPKSTDTRADEEG